MKFESPTGAQQRSNTITPLRSSYILPAYVHRFASYSGDLNTLIPHYNDPNISPLHIDIYIYLSRPVVLREMVFIWLIEF